MEIISELHTENGLEMVLLINGKRVKKVFSYKRLNEFINKEQNVSNKRPREFKTIEPNFKRFKKSDD